MKDNFKISVIIPAMNEAQSIRKVISDIPAWVDEIVVVDNGSTDTTAEVAEKHGAKVLYEPERGYGIACLTGIASLDHPGIVVFLDGDYSDYPEEMGMLVAPIIQNRADMVIGSRALGEKEKGALSPQQIWGNWLACRLMKLFWDLHYTDLGPFRAIRFSTLQSLNMRDRNYGWTVEMQIKAAQRRVRYREVPVRYRKRIGKSKVSGTIRGVIGAGTKILSTIFVAAVDWHFRGKSSERKKRNAAKVKLHAEKR
jgi:glycosyltransferase involved in cell wall biosynthesis